MHNPERSRHAALDQTWPAGVGSEPALMPVSSVSTMRVKLIGANDEAQAPLLDGRTRPYPSALPSFTECSPTEDNEYWHDASGLMETADRSYQALAFAHTLPAISLEDVGLEDSGVREIRRLQLWLHPRDSSPAALPSIEPRDGTPTLRVTAAQRGALAQAWEAWEQQSPGMTIFTATVLCVISALAVSLFAH